MSNTNPFWKITSNQEVTVNEQNPQAVGSMNIWDFRHIRERSVMRKVIRIRFYI